MTPLSALTPLSARSCTNVESRPGRLSLRRIRATAVTNLLTRGLSMEDVQWVAGHAKPQTTRPDDRWQKKLP